MFEGNYGSKSKTAYDQSMQKSASISGMEQATYSRTLSSFYARLKDQNIRFYKIINYSEEISDKLHGRSESDELSDKDTGTSSSLLSNIESELIIYDRLMNRIENSLNSIDNAL